MFNYIEFLKNIASIIGYVRIYFIKFWKVSIKVPEYSNYIILGMINLSNLVIESSRWSIHALRPEYQVMLDI